MIIVEPYNPNWKDTFEAIKGIYLLALKGINCDIEHVGSTAVPGLCAKPVIDIDIIVPDEATSQQAIALLAPLGYTYAGNQGIPQREVLKRSSEHVPYTPDNATWPKHHLYICIAGSHSLLNHLHLRNYLLAHPAAVAQYSALKQELAAKYPNDMDSYVEGKTAFITGILKKTGFDDAVLNGITEQNRAK
jgi:GrpB-like predicted nucleotidyltransferase (UPF0157 family)